MPIAHKAGINNCMNGSDQHTILGCAFNVGSSKTGYVQANAEKSFANKGIVIYLKLI